MNTLRPAVRFVSLSVLLLALNMGTPVQAAPTPAKAQPAAKTQQPAPTEAKAAPKDTGAAKVSIPGTYRIDKFQSRQESGLYHFFYLHPNGTFLLAAEWKDYEHSRIGGQWALNGDRLVLQGHGTVETNKGNWTVDYQRTFVVSLADGHTRLVPIPEKNRFGLMGWPDGFTHVDDKPQSNLPNNKLPADEAGLLKEAQAAQAAK